MSNLFWLTEAQMARLRPFFPKSQDRQSVDNQRVLSGIFFINRNGLRWCDVPREYGPAKTLYNRWKRWSDSGVFAQIMVGLAAKDTDSKTIMIDATYLKAHRTACSLHAKKGGRGRQIGRTKGGMILQRLLHDPQLFGSSPAAPTTAIGDDLNLRHKHVLRHMPKPPWLCTSVRAKRGPVQS